MTSEEVLDALAKDDWRLKMKEVWNDPAFKMQKKACDTYAKELVAAEKADKREVERSRRDAKREAEKVRKNAEKEDERMRKAEEWQAKAAEKLHLADKSKLEKSRLKAVKDAAAAAAKAQKAEAAAAVKAAKAAAHALQTRKMPAANLKAQSTDVSGGSVNTVVPGVDADCENAEQEIQNTDDNEPPLVIERPWPWPHRVNTRAAVMDKGLEDDDSWSSS
jgi:hypothetical protein